MENSCSRILGHWSCLCTVPEYPKVVRVAGRVDPSHAFIEIDLEGRAGTVNGKIES